MMFKFALLLLVIAGPTQVFGTLCPMNPITVADVAGIFPYGAQNITTIDKGTNCTIQFSIPDNYSLLIKFSVDFQSKKDIVTIYDNKNQPRYTINHSGTILYNKPLYMAAKSAGVEVISVSGKTRFFLSYQYIQLNGYKQVKKNTGEPFRLGSIAPNTYCTITASSPNEKVVLNYAQRMDAGFDDRFSEYYIYDGDNINTARMIGNIYDVGSVITLSTGSSISIVNFFNTTYSNSYALGNDASTVKGFNKYKVYLTTLGSTLNGNMTDLSGNEASWTFICTDCSSFYWTKLRFDSMATYANAGYITFQGQTPTHKREKLIRYDPMTFSDNQLPQMIPSNVFTVTFKLSTIIFNMNTINDPTQWKKPFDGRKGFIFSPTLWTSAVNNFDYEFRDDSQLYNFTLSGLSTMKFPASSDKLTLKIGSGTENPAVSNIYPRDQSSNGVVISNGNYMQVGLSASVGADVRLSFEMRKVSAASVIGIMTSIVLTLFYIL